MNNISWDCSQLSFFLAICRFNGKNFKQKNQNFCPYFLKGPGEEINLINTLSQGCLLNLEKNPTFYRPSNQPKLAIVGLHTNVNIPNIAHQILIAEKYTHETAPSTTKKQEQDALQDWK